MSARLVLVNGFSKRIQANLSINPAHTYSSIDKNLTLAEARVCWNKSIMHNVSQLFNRELNAFIGKDLVAPGEFLVPTCRVLCTDRYIPLEQVRTEYCLRTKNNPFIFRSKSNVEQCSNLPVDISWARMAKEYNNVITVGDVQALLPASSIDTHGTDLIKIHLLATAIYNWASPFHFSKESFLEQHLETKQWLDSLLWSARHAASVLKPTESSSLTECDLPFMVKSKMEIFHFLDNTWYLHRARTSLQKLTIKIERLLLDGDKNCSPVKLYQAVKDLCIMINILAPNTAAKAWDILHVNSCWSEYSSGNVHHQNWPVAEQSSRKWPFAFLFIDSDGQMLLHRVMRYSVESVENLNHKVLTDMALSCHKFVKRFGDLNPQIEDVSWTVDYIGTLVKVKVIIKSSSQLTQRLSYIRSL